MNAEEFLNLIHGVDQPIHFRAIGAKRVKPLKGLFRNVQAELTRLNDKGYDIYFVVNKGGTTNEDIAGITAVWSDLDAGKMKNGAYLPMPQVQAFKDEQLRRLDALPCPPSMLVETRNGFHALWLLHPGVTVAVFDSLIGEVVAVTDGDSAAMRLSNILRVPGFRWRKQGKGCDPFPVEVVRGVGTRYHADDLLDSMRVVVPRSVPPDAAVWRNKYWCRSIVPPGGEQPSNPKTLSEIRGVLKRMDPTALLGLPTSAFKCPFHKDTRPSAGAYQSNKNGCWYFKCHAKRCGRSGDMVDLLAQRDRIGTGRALVRLLDQEGIALSTDSPVSGLREHLDAWRKGLRATKAIKDRYPRCWYRIWSSISLLRALVEVALDSMVSDEQFLPDNRYIFCCSTRHLASKAFLPIVTTSRRLAMLTYLGLLVKLADAEIPSVLLTRAQQKRVRHGHPNHIAYFSLPVFSPVLLATGEQRATEFLAKGMTMKGMSKEMMVHSGGSAAAISVYPQANPISARRELKDSVVAAAAQLLATRGYVRRADLYEHLGVHRECQKTAIAKVFPAVVKQLGLTRQYATNKLKRRFRIASKGAPIIFIPPDSQSSSQQANRAA